MLTKAELRERYKYDPKSGSFVYRKDNGKYKAGQPAGSVTVTVSHRLKVDGKNYHLGRVIHRYMTGRKPTGVIDHKNGNSSDFRWNNLRDVSHHANAINAPPSANKTGYTGVRKQNNRGKKYQAYMHHKGKFLSLGYFKTAKEAARAYMKAKRKLHGKYLRRVRQAARG